MKKLLSTKNKFSTDMAILLFSAGIFGAALVIGLIFFYSFDNIF